MERSFAEWLFERLLALMEFIMPDEGGEWARAMRAEANHVEPGAEAVSFAGGCLWAAVFEYLRSELTRRAALLSGGLTAGFVYFAHAAVPGSGAWPLMWPLFGGAMAAFLSAGIRDPLGVSSGAWLGLRTGLVASLLFTVGGAILISTNEVITLDSRLHILALGALLGVGLSAIGAGAATLLLRFRQEVPPHS